MVPHDSTASLFGEARHALRSGLGASVSISDMMLLGGGALGTASVLIGASLLVVGDLTGRSSAMLAVIACLGFAVFHLGIAIACIVELRQS